MKNLEAKLLKSGVEGFRSGLSAAAHFVQDYNELSLHPFRLEDCIRAHFATGRVKTPRRNKPTEVTYGAARRALRGLKVTDEAEVQLARVIATAQWQEYERKSGKVDALTAWMCLQSLETAKLILAAGYRDCAAASAPIAKCMEKDSRKKLLAAFKGKKSKGNTRRAR